MIDRAKLRAQLAKHEGKRQFVYDDATGKQIGEGTFVRGLPTVGIGRNLYGKGLSEDEIEYLVDNDIADVLTDARKFKWFDGLDTVRQNAVTELLFNLGLERFRSFVKFINYMNEGRWVHAAGELKNSKWYTQVKSRGDTIADMVLTGEWPNES